MTVVTTGASQLAIDATQVATRKVFLVPSAPSLEHHLVEHLVIFLRVTSQIRLLIIAPKMRQVYRVRCQRIIKVAYALMIPNAARLRVVPFS